MTSQPASTSDFHKTRHNYLSFTQIADFQKCHYRWSLRYHHGLQTKTVVRPLALGDAVHQAIAANLLDGTDPQTFLNVWRDGRLESVEGDEQLDELNEIHQLAPKIAQRALDKLQKMGWETITIDGRPSVEIDFVVPLPGFDGYIVHIDAIFYDRLNNTLRVADYKVRKAFQDADAEQVNLQHATYMYVAQQHGIPVSSSVTMQLRNESPRKPKLNKNGTMSKAAIISDWETYEAALVEAGLDPLDYLDMKEKLERSEFIRVDYSYRSEVELKNMWERIVLPTSEEIAKEKDKYRQDKEHCPTRHLFWAGHCQNCNFREFCLQNLAGYDTSPMLALFDSFEGGPTSEQT